jgi:acyl-CoA hydrolase
MEVKVTVKVEDLMKENDCHIALTAFFTYVAIGIDGRPVEVPGLLTTSAQEEQEYEAGKRRYEARKAKLNR